MNKRSNNVGVEISDAQLGMVHGGGVTVASDENNNYKLDLKPVVETAKWAWKKIKSWF